MIVWATASAPLAARGLPDTPEAWLGAGLVLAGIGVVLAVGIPWATRRLDRAFTAHVAQETQRSAHFRVQWPPDRLWQAPYDELVAEVSRSWHLVLDLESRNSRNTGAVAADRDRQIVDIKAWISTLLGPLNAAAARERRVVG